MHIVNVVASVSRSAGGVGDAVRRLALEVTSRTGAVNSVVAMHDEFTERDKAAWQPLPLYLCHHQGPKKLGYARSLFRTIQQRKGDLVHTHGLWQYQSRACVLWARQSRRPYVVSVHGMLDPWALRHSAHRKRLAMMLYEGTHLRGAACIRALCSAEVSAIREIGLKNPVCLIPNGVDIEAESVAADLEWPYRAPRSQKILLFLSRIHPKKNVVSLLRAWSMIQAQQPIARQWTLAIAGWGEQVHLQEVAAAAGVVNSGGVEIMGPVFGLRKKAVLSNCTAFVLPSFSEGLPLAALEAWAHAKPVLMTSACNLPSGFQGGAALEVGTSPESICASIVNVMHMDPVELRRMGESGLRLVQSRFAWAGIADALSEVYAWVLGGGSTPSCVDLG